MIELRTKVKLLGVLACSVFLVSVLCPFLQTALADVRPSHFNPGLNNYWSFKETRELSRTSSGTIVAEYQFIDYWFLEWYWNYDFDGLTRLIGPVLILLFELQVLVMLFSALAILLDKRWLFLGSIIFNVVVLFFMWFVDYAFYFEYVRFLATGFWLTLLAALIFVVAFFTSGKP